MTGYQLIYTILIIVLQILFVLVPLLLAVAYLILMERKVIGRMQLRRGPGVLGPFGVLQPIADAIKLLTKEFILPTRIKTIPFFAAPVITFSLALLGWAVIPFGHQSNPDGTVIPSVIANINVGITYLLASSSLGVYGIIIGGWSGRSSYAAMGAMRSAAQMISYELAMGTMIACVLMCSGSANIAEIVLARQEMPFILKCMLMPLTIPFFITILAETNRHPFDLPEAETELVAGYNTEYSSMPFAMFFLGEYANMILMSAIMVSLFFGGWLPPVDISPLNQIPGVVWLGWKIFMLLFVFIWVRAALPRYRYDQLIDLGWKVLLPLSLIWFVATAFVVRFQ